MSSKLRKFIITKIFYKNDELSALFYNLSLNSFYHRKQYASKIELSQIPSLVKELEKKYENDPVVIAVVKAPVVGYHLDDPVIGYHLDNIDELKLFIKPILDQKIKKLKINYNVF